MAPKSKGSRLRLGDELHADLLDYRAANHWPDEIKVVRDAVEFFLTAQLEDRTIKRRFDAARRKRLRIKDGSVATFRPRKG